MITCNELFSGIGSQRLALKNINVPHKIIGISEIDKFSIKSYEAIHEPTYNYGDISKIDKLNYADFWTYSFPCQDISLSGKQEGLGKGTRSGLLYEVQRLLNVSKEHNELPKYLMLENVKNLVGKKFKKDFENWLEDLNDLGYNNYWQILNAKDYGIPQNRERVFVISIRKDIDDYKFTFPQPILNDRTLRNFLENSVEEKFYLSFDKIKEFTKDFIPIETTGCKVSNQGKIIEGTVDVCSTLMARDYKGFGDQRMTGVVEVKSKSKSKNITLPCIGASRGRYNENGEIEQKFELNMTNCTNTLTTVQKDNLLFDVDFRIRRLTPREHWRLMGFGDNDFDKASQVCSNTQLYKQAGNSIVVNVLEAIFRNLFE